MNKKTIIGLPPTARPGKPPRWGRYSAVVDTAMRFSWTERLQILLGCVVIVRTWNTFERPPGRVDCASKCYVDPARLVVIAAEKKAASASPETLNP